MSQARNGGPEGLVLCGFVARWKTAKIAAAARASAARRAGTDGMGAAFPLRMSARTHLVLRMAALVVIVAAALAPPVGRRVGPRADGVTAASAIATR